MWAALLKAMLVAMAQNSAKASKGEEANATISPMALIPGSPGTAETSTMGTVKTAPTDYYKSAEAVGMKNYIKDTGGELLNSLNPVGTAYAGESTNMPNANLGKIFVNPNKQFNRIESNNPEEFPTGGIPEQYRGMGQGGGNPQNTQRPDVGFMRGLINAATAQPQPEGLGDVSQGRKTAYYSGELIPKIIMSKLGQPSPAEASEAQSRISQRERWSEGQPVIDPQTGTVMYVRPKGSVFKPVSLEEKTQTAINTELGKEKAKGVVATGKEIQGFNSFIGQFDRSYNELNKTYPNIGEKGIGGFATRGIAGLGEKLGYFPETSAFMKELQPKANMMARTIEGGRITDLDRKIYADSFANALQAPSETNVRLMSNSLIGAQLKGGDISTILDVLSKSNNPILQQIVEQVNLEGVNNRISGGFDFSNNSTEELLRRRQQLLQGGGQ